MRKSKTGWIVGGVVVVIVILMAMPSFSKENRELNGILGELGVGCLTMGHTNLAQHIHPVLEVIVDGARQTIPANVGITPGCMAEVHTHEANGVIHIETVAAGKTFTLGTFLQVWGYPYDRSGFTAQLTVDGVPSAAGANLVLKDNQQITLTYIKR